MHVFRVRIYQPQAHYRVPFTYQRRHTYPIPPYSTVIGFLCNILGYDSMPAECENLKKLKISIAGRFESKTTEYVWFRNLSKSAHESRFGTTENRSIGGHVEHIGGQSPVLIDILNDVRVIIHLAHEEEKFLAEVNYALRNPMRRLDVLHLGRAEDWIVVEEISNMSKLSMFQLMRVDANFEHFFWIPEKMFLPESQDDASDFDQFDGLIYRLPTFWTVENYAETRNRHGKRIFDYMTAKLSEGLFTGKRFLFDRDCKLPVFLADLGG